MEKYIVGDSVPESVHAGGSEARMGSSRARLAAADVARIGYRARSRRRLAAFVRGRTFDFLYERYALMQELGPIARSPATPWILEVNALLAIEATTERKATSSRRMAAAFERRTLRSADLIVAVTDHLAEAISAEYDIPRSRIMTVENGVETSVHGVSAGLPQAVPTLGFLGSLYSWQRLDELLLAMSSPANADWRLRVAGSGPEFAALETQAMKLGLSDRVEFLGRVHPDEVPAFLQTVDLCFAGHGSANGVYFSPLKLWEYLAAGRPVLASSHEATSALEASGFAVRCFDSGDDLSATLTASRTDRGRLLELALASQQKVWDNYSWSARIRPLLARIEEWK